MTIYFASYETKIFQTDEFLSGNIHQLQFFYKIFQISFGGTTPLKIIKIKIFSYNHVENSISLLLSPQPFNKNDFYQSY